jgi:hypothetical protein
MMVAMDDGTFCDHVTIEDDSEYDSGKQSAESTQVGPTDGDTEITVGDIWSAFLTSPRYLENEGTRFVAFREYRGGQLRCFRLLVSLYGQKDAPFRFYESLSKFLKRLGFEQCKNDVCLYVHRRRGMLVGTHVDDLIARGNRHQSEWFWTQMEAQYKLKNWGYVETGSPKT